MKKLIIIFVLILGNNCRADAIAQWKCNDNLATSVVLDAIGSNNGAFTDAGGTPTTLAHHCTGHIDGGFEFDGDDDHIIVGDAEIFSPVGTAFSISAWISMPSDGDELNFKVVSKYGSGKEEWALFVDMSGYLCFTIEDSANSAYIGQIYDAYNLTEAVGAVFWHVVATYGGGTSSDDIKIYWDGSLVDTNDLEDGVFVTVVNSDQFVVIGYDTKDVESYIDGQLDNIMIFDTELTAAEVTSLYNGGTGTEDPGVLAVAGEADIRTRYLDDYRQSYRSRYK